MTRDDLPDGMNPKEFHLFFQPGTDEDKAAATFACKTGHPPEYIAEVTGRLWLGPVNDDPHHV